MQLLRYLLNCVYLKPRFFSLFPFPFSLSRLGRDEWGAQLPTGVNPQQKDNRIKLLPGCNSKPLWSPRKQCSPDAILNGTGYSPRTTELLRLAVTSGGGLLRPPAQSRVNQGRLPRSMPVGFDISRAGDSTPSLVPLQFCLGIAHNKS